MFHVIAVLGLVAGFLLSGYGALQFGAGAMSDAPIEGNEAASDGAKLTAIGAALIAASVLALWTLHR